MFNWISTAIKKDPALQGGIRPLEILLYPGMWALLFHRISRPLFLIKIPFIPRLLSQIARVITGIEIHPGAQIGKRFFIDHGYGVVVGETAVIGDDVMIYHDVTLGALGWWQSDGKKKRHPTIANGVVIGAGARILGPVKIGRKAKIGVAAVVIHDVPAKGVVVSPLGTLLSKSGKEKKFQKQEMGQEPEWTI
jgi:serine O-acetyltransferase